MSDAEQEVRELVLIFGGMAPPLADQFAAQGYELSKGAAAAMQADADAITAPTPSQPATRWFRPPPARRRLDKADSRRPPGGSQGTEPCAQLPPEMYPLRSPDERDH